MRTHDLAVMCVLLGSASLQLESAPQPAPASDATSALTCVQNALGGTAAFAAVSSLYIKGETKSAPNASPHPVPGSRELSVVFPDRYLLADLASEGGLDGIVGYDKTVILSRPRFPDPQAKRYAQQSFALEMLMRLPRMLSNLRMVQRVASEAGQERLVIEAFGPESFRAALFVDRRTCVPVSLDHQSEGRVMHFDLSGYRSFGGIRFPTVLKQSLNGQPFMEEYVARIEVNTPTAAKAFSTGR